MSPLVILLPRKGYLQHFGSKIAKIVRCYCHNLGQSERKIFDISLCVIQSHLKNRFSSAKKQFAEKVHTLEVHFERLSSKIFKLRNKPDFLIETKKFISLIRQNNNFFEYL